MIVNLQEFKRELTRAKVALSTGALDGTDGYVMLLFRESTLRIGARGVSLSYTGVIKGGQEETVEDRRVYIAFKSLGVLLSIDKKNKTLQLFLDGEDLHFLTDSGQGVITTSVGMKHWKPFANPTGEPYILLHSGQTLAEALALACEVKQRWTTKTLPYAAGFVRLAIYDEAVYPDFHQVETDVCRILLDTTTSEQDDLLEYASGIALSVFASDESRYYQMFEPAYFRPETEQSEQIPVTTILNPEALGIPIHLRLVNAAALRKVLGEDTYRVHLLRDGKNRVEAITFFNATTFIWVEVALHSYPDADFNQQLAYLHGSIAATFTATADFKKTLSTIESLSSAREHGLTFRIEKDSIYISSPEGGDVVSYGSIEAHTLLDIEETYIINPTGMKSALTKMRDEITVIVGHEFVAFYNKTTASRIILRTYNQG